MVVLLYKSEFGKAADGIPFKLRVDVKTFAATKELVVILLALRTPI
jgi:hypothetical protein